MIKVVSTVCLNFNQLEEAHSLQRVKDNFSWQSQSQLLEPEIAKFFVQKYFLSASGSSNRKWKILLLNQSNLKSASFATSCTFAFHCCSKSEKDKTLESVLEINIYLKVFKKFQNQRMTKNQTLKFILKTNKYLKFVKTFQLFWKFFSGTMSD